MPFYEYRCESCEYQLEALQKISDSPLISCPQCGQPSLKRLISPSAFRLKGSGWYETDFKKSGKKNLHESGAKEQGAKEGKTEDAGAKEAKVGDAGAKGTGTGGTPRIVTKGAGGRAASKGDAATR